MSFRFLENFMEKFDTYLVIGYIIGHVLSNYKELNQVAS